MELQNITLTSAIIFTGLSAGLFYGWSVSVIPGTQKIDAHSYVSTMQSINRAILNPAFFLVFFGSIICLISATFAARNHHPNEFWILLIATTTYLIGTIGVTGLGNVPLNDELEALNIRSLSSKEITDFRMYYESRWNTLHTYRMLFSVVTFIMTVITINLHSKH